MKVPMYDPALRVRHPCANQGCAPGHTHHIKGKSYFCVGQNTQHTVHAGSGNSPED
jgi:hypothetical protein